MPNVSGSDALPEEIRLAVLEYGRPASSFGLTRDRYAALESAILRAMALQRAEARTPFIEAIQALISKYNKAQLPVWALVALRPELDALGGLGALPQDQGEPG